MLDSKAAVRAIDLQEKSYELLRWMADAVATGFIQFKTAHRYGTLPDAAHGWIRRHFNDIPPKARPTMDDLPDFGRLFATYLENSFDLIQDPGKRRYSPDAHCFCPMCSWLVDVPNLRTKKVKPIDKQRAKRMKLRVLAGMALELEVDAARDSLDRLVVDPGLREALSLVTWVYDLQARLSGQVRLDGNAIGAAPLALWRGFAWTSTGSPKKNFRPAIDDIQKSEKMITESLLALKRQ